MKTCHLIIACVALLTAFSTQAFAANLSGTITDSQGAGIGGGAIQVRLWSEGIKGWEIVHQTLTGNGGGYTITNVEPGEYKLNARMAPGFDGHYGDTWYDITEPSSDGIFGADADIIPVGSNHITGLDITMPHTGGLEGSISPGQTSSFWVRAESTTDHRYHHNTLADFLISSTQRRFSFRGLRNSHTFRLIIYDPSGRYGTTVRPGTESITNGVSRNLANLSVPTTMPSDPQEPNNTWSQATEITGLPFVSNGAVIYPRGQDIDWYCYDAAAGDRFLATADARLTVDGEDRRHPWIDPIMSLFRVDGADPVMLQYNDDDPRGNGLSSFIDSGILQAGRYCLVVSTFGDNDFSGTGQQSAGAYTLSVEMGNRSPYLEVRVDQILIPTPPQPVEVREGDNVLFSIAYGDPDNDPVQLRVIHVDRDMTTVQGVLTDADGMATYAWEVGPDSADTSPHLIYFEVEDAEFVVREVVTVEIGSQGQAPPAPTLVSPVGRARVGAFEVDLVLENATDPSGAQLSYEFEWRRNSVEEPGTVETADEGQAQTMLVAGTFEENDLVNWRARAQRIETSVYSAWTEWETFLVDTVNDPPQVPEIYKPVPNEIVLTATPRIAAYRPTDPEQDPVSVVFAVARDADFQSVVFQSDPIPVMAASENVEWTTANPLQRDTSYFVRAMALDDRGGVSPWSEPVEFRVRIPLQANPPGFSAELEGLCAAQGVFLDGRRVWTVQNQPDAIAYELEILDEGVVLFSTEVPASQESQTVIPIDISGLDPGEYLVRVRASVGEAQSEWSECIGLIQGESGAAITTGAEDGCGCASGPRPKEGLFWVLIFAGLAFYRRWRPSKRRPNNRTRS